MTVCACFEVLQTFPYISQRSRSCDNWWLLLLPGVEFDVLVAGCLLDPERWKESTTQSKGPLEPRHQQRSVLPPMTAEVLGTPVHDLTSALAALHDGQTRASKSAGDDWDAAGGVWAVHALRQVYERELRHLADGGKLLKLLQDVEVPVQRVLSDMEYAGLGVDRELMQRQKQEIQVGTEAQAPAVREQGSAAVPCRISVSSLYALTICCI